MDKEELVEINFSDIEEEMRKYNKNFEKISLKKISENLNDYQLFSTLLDDHFTILVRCASKSAVKKAKDFLTKAFSIIFTAVCSVVVFLVNKSRINELEERVEKLEKNKK